MFSIISPKPICIPGATVILGCRHMGKCEDAAVEIRRLSENKHVVCRFLNLADLNSVKEFAETIQKGKVEGPISTFHLCVILLNLYLLFAFDRVKLSHFFQSYFV